MKAIVTTFAIAMMVFAFNATPSHANDAGDVLFGCTDEKREKPQCRKAALKDVRDPDQAGGETDVADSGEEGSTSAAGTDEQ